MTSSLQTEPLLVKAERLDDLLTELDVLTEENIEPTAPRLSIYLSAGRRGEDSARGRIHLGNALGEAERRLAENGLPEKAIENFLADLRPLADRERCGAFWDRQLEGLAIFADRQRLRLVQAAEAFEPEVRLSSQWWLTPLLALGANVEAYWLLSLARNEVKLYRGSRLGIREFALPPGTPRRFEDSDAAATRRDGDDPDAPSNGDADKRLLSRFFAELDAGVTKAIGERHADPLILAGVDHYLPLYERANTYPTFSGRILSGNPERLELSQLHQRALDALSSEFIQSRKRELLKLHARFDSDEVESRLERILEAATAGRVSALVAPADGCRWGRYERDQVGRVLIEDLPEGDARGRDLFQEAAEESLRHGGRLFYLESSKMPRGKSLCAELRH